MRHIFVLSSVRTLALALALAGSGKAAFGQQPESAGPSQRPAQEQAAAGAAAQPDKAPVIPDVVVLDQDNRQLHFYRDLVQGKTVAINFIFTTCTTICPPLTANFAKVQKTMLARGQGDLHLISISVDPENDTPERLKSYATLFRAKPGWTFVTGNRTDLEKIWKAFNISLASKQDHPPTVAIGNDVQRVWVYASGLTTADKLMSAISPLLGDKKPESSGNAQPAKDQSSGSR